MLEKPREDAAGTEGVRLERDEDEDGRRKGVSRVLQMRIQLRDEGAREIHGSRLGRTRRRRLEGEMPS